MGCSIDSGPKVIVKGLICEVECVKPHQIGAEHHPEVVVYKPLSRATTPYPEAADACPARSCIGDLHKVFFCHLLLPVHVDYTTDLS